MSAPLTHISLFSGAMGLDIGLARAGFGTLAAVEIDRAARETIRLNAPPGLPVFGDVEQVSAQTLLSVAGLRRSEVALISGGPPCQPFSTAGRRAALNDPRGSLFRAFDVKDSCLLRPTNGSEIRTRAGGSGQAPYGCRSAQDSGVDWALFPGNITDKRSREFLRLVDGIQPRFFVMENVRGLLSATLKHRPISERGSVMTPEEERGSAFEVILSEFRRIGYSVEYGLVNAADYGTPQTRQRVILLGSRDHEALSLPAATHSEQGGALPRWRTLRDALADLDDPEPRFQPYSEQRLKFLHLIPESGNWRSLPPELRREAMGGAFDSGGGKVGFYRRLSWDRPAPTVTTSPAQKATDMCHPALDRPISVREAARLQGFPDDWRFCGSLSDQYRQIGNAVPIPLGEAIGRSLAQSAQGGTLAPSRTTSQPRLLDTVI